ncbi:hypothetical protein B4W17_RS28025, partial [Escherichia coli]
ITDNRDFLIFLSVNQPELKFPLTHMLFLIRFSVFQKKQNTAISVNTARDIRLSKKSEDYHPDLLHKTSRVAEFSASGYHSP